MGDRIWVGAREFRAIHEILDLELQKLNSDYEAKRYNNMTLNKPKYTAHVQGFSTIGSSIKTNSVGKIKSPDFLTVENT